MPPPLQWGGHALLSPRSAQEKMGGRGPRPGWNLPRPRSGARGAPRALPRTGKLVAPTTPLPATRTVRRYEGRPGLEFVSSSRASHPRTSAEKWNLGRVIRSPLRPPMTVSLAVRGTGGARGEHCLSWGALHM